MVKRVKWTQKADRELARMSSYLQDEISEQAAERLINVVNRKIEQLKKHPEIGRRVLTTETVRFVIIDKNRLMYYRFASNILHITAFFDTRQSPDKRPY